MTDFIKEFVDTKKAIAELENKLEQLKPLVEQKVVDSDGMKLTTEFGEFKMVYVPKWEYSTYLTNQETLLKDKLKLMKKKEELEGIAQKTTDGGRLVFTSKKE